MMLKWSKNRGQKKGEKKGDISNRNLGTPENIQNDNSGSGIRISQTMVDQESALAEARRRFSAQLSIEPSPAGQISPEIPEIHVDTPSDTWRPVPLNHQSSFTPYQSDNCSLASETSFDQGRHSNVNTLERRSRSNNILVPETSHSNSSTLERGGAKSKYYRFFLSVTVHINLSYPL